MATTPRTSAAAHTLPGPKLRRVTEHIQAHLDQDLTLAHLGAVVYMSPYHFARRFQHSTGLPPHRFVVRERIDRAVMLLAAPALSIAHISQVVGFCTPSHFSTTRQLASNEVAVTRRTATQTVGAKTWPTSFP